MAEAPVRTIDVAEDAAHPGRYRWSVSENMKVRDKSLYSFRTKREARLDAIKFVLTLNDLGPPHP
jgi:hypothetical protein